MGLLYGRAGRLTALFGGFRPGQWADTVMVLREVEEARREADPSFRFFPLSEDVGGFMNAGINCPRPPGAVKRP